jgi:hypothetical protein
MPSEILKLLREIRQVISRHLQATNDPVYGLRYRHGGAEVVPVNDINREDWVELQDKITDAIEEEERLCYD